jgi:ferritin-like metal-binding protein YciE
MSVASGIDLLAKELRDIRSAEQMIARALPRFSKEVSSEELREKLDERLEEGQEILEAVEQELEELELPAGRRRNPVVEGLLQDTTELVREIEADEVFDAAMIAEVQKLQHYCLAAWGTTAAYAREIEEDALVEVMERAIEHGKRYDEELTQLAEEEVNPIIFEMKEDEEMMMEEREDGRQRGDGGGRSQRGPSQQASGRGRSGQGSGRGSQARASGSESRGSRSGSRSQARSGGAREGSGGAREESADLRQREYRDPRTGEIRHHTRSYMARHGGGRSRQRQG